MTRAAAKYATAIVLAHLLVSIVHGAAHRALGVELTSFDSIFVMVIVVVLPLLAMALIWTTRQRAGFFLLSLSMFGSLMFGLYHHFLASSPDHVHSQPTSPWGMTFVLTAYGLVITEVVGAYVGIHFLTFTRAPQ